LMGNQAETAPSKAARLPAMSAKKLLVTSKPVCDDPCNRLKCRVDPQPGRERKPKFEV
jgi:hypothetical protein